MTTTPTPAAAADLPEALRLIEGIQWYTSRRKAVPLQYAERACDHLHRMHAALSAAAPAVAPDLQRLHDLLYSAQRQTSHDAMHGAITAARIELFNLMDSTTTEQSSGVAQAHREPDYPGENVGETRAAMQRLFPVSQAGAEGYPPSDSKQVFFATMRSIYGNEFPDQGAFAGEHGWGNEWAIFQAGAALRAGHAAPPAQQPGAAGELLILSNGVREYLQEGIDNATGGEEAEIDRDFADELQTLLHNTLYLSAPAAPSAQGDAPLPSDAQLHAACKAYAATVGPGESKGAFFYAGASFMESMLAAAHQAPAAAPPAPTQEAAQPAAGQGEAEALLDFLGGEYIDLRCFAIPTGQGDADIGWRTIQHHMGKPKERVVSEVYRDDPRQAIREAIARLKRDPYCIGDLHLAEEEAIDVGDDE